MRLVVLPTAELAAAAAAEAIATSLRSAIELRGRASLALSGGKTPVEMVRRLAEQDVRWSLVDLFQVDERVVAADDPGRNWSVFTPVVRQVRATGRHPMPVDAADGDRLYRDELLEALGEPVVIDVMHLGLGSDGHTASLVPGSAAVEVIDREVAWAGPYRGHRRMTLTVPVLRAARHQVWLVAGDDKSQPLADLVSGAGDTPGVRVLCPGSSTVFADQLAAALATAT